jgi:hypothetical protein
MFSPTKSPALRISSVHSGSNGYNNHHEKVAGRLRRYYFLGNRNAIGQKRGDGP